MLFPLPLQYPDKTLTEASKPQIRCYIGEVPAGNTTLLCRQRQTVKALIEEAFNHQSIIPVLEHRSTGAPWLKGAPGDLSAISVTHCKEVAAIALAPEGTCLGIDAESANRSNQLHRVANKFLSPHQQQQLQMLAENSQAKHSMLLTEAWTIKEAMYKALQISGLSLASIPLPEQLDSTLPFFGTIHFMDNIFDVCVSWIDTRLPERHSSCLAIVSSHICRLPF